MHVHCHGGCSNTKRGYREEDAHERFIPLWGLNLCERATVGQIAEALHRDNSPGIVFIFSQEGGGRISVMSKTNTESSSNEYY
jgi:hypothetical protein